MKKKTQWILAAFAYLTILIVAFFVFQGSGNENHHSDQGSQQVGHHANHSDHKTDSHAGHSNEPSQSEVVPVIDYDGEKMLISFKNLKDEPVTELQINHEKLVHLIVVGDDLEFYQHYHPKEVGDGSYELDVKLPEGYYKVFPDIKPVGYDYVVEGIDLSVGANGKKKTPTLVGDAEFKQTKDNYTVIMKPSSFKANEEVQLRFEIGGGNPEKYLGALGHVVIIDEKIKEFLHVHPVSETETTFATQFPHPGKYKIFAEFKLDGTVYYFPYVVEVQ